MMSIPNLSLEGQVAIVTGGGTGIGRSIALEFAKAGADVVVASRRLSVLEEVGREVTVLGKRSLAVPVDITKKAEVDNLVQRAMDEFGGIDILVNNAGTIVRASLLEHSEQDWDRVLDTNLKGYYLCSQAVGTRMIEQKKGNIINIASIRGITAAPGRASYCVSKAAVLMLTRVLAVELASYNIRVNAIAPGWVKTNLNEVLWGDPETYKQITDPIPMGHWAELSEIASVALFLASDASSYMTGHTIVVDGGLLA